MAKPALVFVCADCGAETLKWQGQCPQCSAWNSLEQRSVARRPAAQPGPSTPIAGLAELAAGNPVRLGTGMGELDAVLGGGLIPGSVTLLGGEPGIGGTPCPRHEEGAEATLIDREMAIAHQVSGSGFRILARAFAESNGEVRRPTGIRR